MNPSFYELDPILQDSVAKYLGPVQYDRTIRRMSEGPYQSFMKGVESGEYGRDEFIAMGFALAEVEECDKDYLSIHAKVMSAISNEQDVSASELKKAMLEEAKTILQELPAFSSLDNSEREIWINRIVNLQILPGLYNIAHA
jgi:hypothetical protein